MEDNIISLFVVASLICFVGIAGSLLDKPINNWLNK
ncbi:hypothetical protein IEA_05655 [Bacillus toyonensis]|nr:hypothetical protein IEA_05655 [Bacillus toyonensis]